MIQIIMVVASIIIQIMIVVGVAGKGDGGRGAKKDVFIIIQIIMILFII